MVPRFFKYEYSHGNINIFFNHLRKIHRLFWLGWWTCGDWNFIISAPIRVLTFYIIILYFKETLLVLQIWTFFRFFTEYMCVCTHLSSKTQGQFLKRSSISQRPFKTSCYTKVKKPCLLYSLFISGLKNSWM